MNIPDAPWIQETERTGYCRSGWWNNPPEEWEQNWADEEAERAEDYEACFHEWENEGDEDNTFLGYTHLIGDPNARRKVNKAIGLICFGLSVVEAVLAGLGFITLLTIINW